LKKVKDKMCKKGNFIPYCQPNPTNYESHTNKVGNQKEWRTKCAKRGISFLVIGQTLLIVNVIPTKWEIKKSGIQNVQKEEFHSLLSAKPY
jgi:hypothetical protein